MEETNTKPISNSDFENKSVSTLIEICKRQELEINSLNKKIQVVQLSNQTLVEAELNNFLNSFSVEKLKQAEERELFEFSELAKELINKVQKIFDWYKPISEYLSSPDLLSDKQKKTVENQIESINIESQKIKSLQNSISQIQPLLLEFQSAISAIENEEKSLVELLSQKENLESRKIELEELKRKVEEGKLIELKNEVEALSTELAPNEAEHNKLKSEIDLLLKSKSEFEEKLNQSIAKKLFLTNASELIKNIEKEINEYQEKHLKNCGNQIEECKIKIDFTKITSSELLNKDDLNNLDSIEKRLIEIDTRIKERLQPQK
jgi:hypothetical protein